MTFNAQEHVIQLKSKAGSADYLPVQWRLVWFREECPNGTIDTEELEVDLDREMEEEGYAWNNETRRSEKVMKRAKGYARYRAIVTDGKGGRATGTKSEKAVSFPDFVEKAETGAIGRALAALGYGTQFAPEMNEEHRIVDAPVDRIPQGGNGHRNAPVARQDGQQTGETVRPSIHTQAAQVSSESSPANAGITEQQISSIRILCQKLGRRLPEDLEEKTYMQAKTLIGELNTQYKDSRKVS